MDVMADIPARIVNVGAALAERERAHLKHGADSIEGVTGSDANARMLAILVEEIGEVAHEMTYDQDGSGLRAELVQVMAVTWAWLDKLP